MPFERNLCFTGRESQLAQLEEKLFAQGQTTKIAITGLGGVGKTQLVLELAYRAREKHKNCSVVWILAAKMESLQQGYLNVAQQLGIPGWKEEKVDVKKLVQDYLSKESAGQWLLVFDNADNIDMCGTLLEHLPRSKQGCIIFTTRDRKTAVKLAQQSVVEVAEMDEPEATKLLQKCLINQDLVREDQDRKALLAQLTYLPLAMVQAAAYINENGIELADYLSLLGDQEQEVIDLLSEEFEDDRRYHDMKDPVATTWLISFEQIRKRDPLAADLLSFMSCVDPKNVPQSLLPPGSSRKKETDAIGTLNAYSFVSKRLADRALDVHRLVHLATRNWLGKEDRLKLWTKTAIARLREVFPDDDHKNRSIWRMYLPHARYALDSDLINKDEENRLDLAWKFGSCLYEDGRWNEAEVSLTQVMEARKRVLGVEHRNTLNSMNNLALTYNEQGRWKEAEELNMQDFEARKRVLGVEHPDTLTSMNNLALTYWKQGRWKKAEELEVQVIETRKRVLGVEHPHTLISMGNLALTYNEQGRWKEAEELHMQDFEARKRVLGVEHPDTLISMNNLALTYWKQGRWKEAEELGMQVIETRKRVLGVEHPDTLISMGNLASTYNKINQGRWKEAEELNVQVFEARKRVLGVEHPDTLISMSNLAFTWKGQGRHEDALKLMEECAQRRKRVLGVDHPNTFSSSSWLIKWQAEELSKVEIGAPARKNQRRRRRR